ncbi:UNVERIFIED_CONTAM: hypothetical protein Sradi_2930200 [Sesamum radiatum]|uniref:ATP-dependent DNA helicase n=1 Tax=Sesamum radiatum TaxID=300843 RepID=A0AAW2RZ19_SESRA
MQQVQFYSFQRISDVLSDERNYRTMLTEFFRVYNEGQEPNQYLYSEFPKYYRWMSNEKVWQKRRSQQKVIGRIYVVSPNEGERFYLRIILNHVRGPKSFDDLLTVNHFHYPTFKQAAEKRGFLEEDDSIRQCLIEARAIRMPSALRTLFATILLYCQPTGVRRLWEENYPYMIEDYPSSSSTNNVLILNRLLHEINSILLQHKRSLKEFDLPQIAEDYQDLRSISSLIEDELNLPIPLDDLNAVNKLNPALLASFRNVGLIMVATATSGIAAIQLPGGRTAHSKLKIPIKLDSSSRCNFSKQSEVCQLLHRAAAIIWDEAPMADRKAIETVDRTLREMFGVDLPFGGKIMILGGDFRQVVPVVVGGTRSQAVKASIMESHLWSSIKVLHLVDNIRAQNDQSFSDFLLRIGNGEEPTVEDNMIRIPDSMAISFEGEHSIHHLIESTFPDLGSHIYDPEYMMDRALITPLNDDVNKLNENGASSFHQ